MMYLHLHVDHQASLHTFFSMSKNLLHFADDTIGVIKGEKSANHFINTVETPGILWAVSPLKILGIIFTYNEQKQSV